ncbi:MAG TPA: hypothetical protein VG755_29755 [Nannocystaceae bacterium]|nr:hypothetical protein [Nannocystaceae bacterium]
MLPRTPLLVVVALVTACGPTRSSGDGESTSTSSSTSSTSSTTDVAPSTTETSTTTAASSSSESTSTTANDASSTGSTDTSSDVASSSETADVPAPYGPCGACGPDEVEIDGGPHCVCAPPCRVGADCPGPGTGADPACALEENICVLLCESEDQCPEGMHCPNPADLPEGAKGFCYHDD